MDIFLEVDSKIYKNFVYEKINYLLFFNLLFMYIDNVLVINNCYLYFYVDWIYFSELEIENIIEFV